MSTATACVRLETYLNTVYRPDRDYVDGRLEKRNEGKWSHAELQAALVQYLRTNAERFRVRTVQEIRVRVSPTRYRVADVCCVRRAPEDTGRAWIYEPGQRHKVSDRILIAGEIRVPLHELPGQRDSE